MITLAKTSNKWLLQPLFSGMAIALASMTTSATPLSLSDVPLFLTTNVSPNLLLTLDDSLSMMRGYAPETVDNSLAVLDGPRFKSATYNGIYYNPKLVYTIPARSDGTSYSTSFTTAYFNGFDTSKGSVDLSSGYKVIAQSKPDHAWSGCASYIAANNSNYSSCLLAKNPGTTTTTPYSFNCTWKFNQHTGDDSLDLSSGCSSPFSGASTPAVGTPIVVTGTPTGTNYRNGTYTVKSVASSTSVIITENLGSDVTESATLSWSVTSSGTNTNAVPAYYYLYYTQKSGATQPTGCDNNKETDACYIKIEVGSTDDIAAGSTANQKQNFANWYSFYRTRALSVMSGAMNAVTDLANDSVRLGWQTINGCTSFGTTCQGYETTNSENRIRTLSTAHKTNLYNWLQRFELNGSTPTRTALKRAGDYFMTSGQDSPYAKDPYVTVGTELSCRRNYHVLFTDGLWNNSYSDPVNPDDPDSSGTTALPDGNSYTPQAPYKDVNTTLSSTYTNSDSLADIAFYYWATDLRNVTGTALVNNITPHTVDQTGTATEQYWNPKNDPATWQHMVNFTIGLGLSNSLIAACNYEPGSSPVVADPNNPTPGCPVWGGSTFAGDYAALKAGTKNWPRIKTSPSLGNEPDGHVYDLWHTAINSRGKFFSADDPISLNNAFQSIFSTIISTNASSAAAAANSTSIQTGTVLYQAQFDSRNWSGHLYNFTVSSDGTVKDLNSDGKLDGNDANWDAATKIPASRTIKTINGTTGLGVDFLWDNSANANNLSVAQKTALKTSSSGVGSDALGQDRLNWLRGDTTKEVRNGGSFRNRTVTVLGDIINSDPMFSHTEDYGYKNLPVTATEQSTYAAFVSGKSTGPSPRPPMVYDGANDGMLHAFRADTAHADKGKELFAYVPAAVYGNLSSLTETDYSHKYFVDGSPSVGDAYLSGWKTVLVGGLGKGGKAIYALDISNPAAFTDSHVLWEYSGSTATATDGTGTTDADGMGLTYSQPQIARLNDGSWAAIFGNGYNSTSERAFLYIVNLSTGALIKKIPTNTATSNGLSTPRLYDSNPNPDKIIDFVYAGDLQGNLWKFDLSAANPDSWGLGYGGNPLFTAKNAGDQIQPITAQPTIGAHSGGVLVYFGTGSYLTNTDVSDTTVQSFYAIWDKPGASLKVERSSLVQQTITTEVKVNNGTFQDCINDPVTTDINECNVTFDLRTTSANTVDYTSKFGWYMDLVPQSPGVAAGERVISSALLKFDRVIFLTAIPSADPCVPGGNSWLMEIDASTGGATGTSSFDFNNDNKFDDKDKLPSNNTNTASGVKSTVGMVKAAVWLDKEGAGIAYKEMSGTTSNIMSLKNKGSTVTTGTVDRLYWLQIQ